MIEAHPFEKDSIAIFASGERFAIFGPLNTKEQIDRFVALCRADPNIEQLVAEAKSRREWNWAHSGQGRDWPAFGKLERLIDKLTAQAGMKTS